MVMLSSSNIDVVSSFVRKCNHCESPHKIPNLFGFSETPVQPTEAPPQTGRWPIVFNTEMKKLLYKY